VKKHIYIYSPSSAVRDKVAFRRGVRRLQALGHNVELDADALSSHMRFAGDDAARLAAIARAAASGADVALISRGGYGLTRILPALPYADMARAIEAGMHWVGLSDFTALQLGLMAHQQRARAPGLKKGRATTAAPLATADTFGPGAITWAGPALGEDFGADPKQGDADNPLPDDIMEACFDDLLSGLGEGTGWRLPKADALAAVATVRNFDIESTAEKSILSSAEATFSIENAVLWGGNLTVLASLVGTPWLPSVPGGVLFLEDVNEHPFRIERMLTQLLHAGILGQQRAVVLGQFNRYKLVPLHDRGYKLATVVAWLRGHLDPLGVPVLTELPFGHVHTKVLLPVGRMVDLAVQGRDALMFWGD
jgi:muramoyltetrapeptide carboxypeptidase